MITVRYIIRHLDGVYESDYIETNHVPKLHEGIVSQLLTDMFPQAELFVVSNIINFYDDVLHDLDHKIIDVIPVNIKK